VADGDRTHDHRNHNPDSVSLKINKLSAFVWKGNWQYFLVNQYPNLRTSKDFLLFFNHSVALNRFTPYARPYHDSPIAIRYHPQAPPPSGAAPASAPITTGQLFRQGQLR